MIDINKMRRLALDGDLAAMQEIILRLEAAESDALEQARLNGMGASREAALMAKLEVAEKEAAHIKEVEFPRKMRAVAVGWEKKCARLEQERDALRAKIEAMERMEKQEPSREWWDSLIADISAIDCMYRGSPTYAHDAYWMRDHVVWMLKKRRDALPGTKGEEK